MANPQPTDAHLRIAHSINEAMMMRDFTKRQRKILDLILRLSWGCGKKDAYIPHQNDFCIVGVYESDVKTELIWLEQSKIIIRHGMFYWFNKDFDQWQISRVKPFQPERLGKLLSINLNGNRPELSKTLSQDLVKHEVPTSQNTKSATSDLASPKESIKEKVKKEDINIDSNSYSSWLKVLKILGAEINPSNFRTWLRQTIGVEETETEFVIATPNQFVADHLENNMASLIEKVITGVTNKNLKPKFIIFDDDI